MREFLETIEDAFKHMAIEGEDTVALDDSSLEILRRMAGQCTKELQSEPRQSTVSSESTGGGKPKVLVQKPKAEEFIDDVEEIKFVEKIEVANVKKSPIEQKKLKIKLAEDLSESIAAIPMPTPFKSPKGTKRERWEAMREIVLNDPVCNAHIKADKKVVFGVGNLDAKIFFCGEAPGGDEEIQGEPFVGKAGQLLTKIIGAMGLSREDVYIGNIMNWRPETPKGNRKPTEEEMRYCLPYLLEQVDIVSPQIIVALGMTAVEGLLGVDPSRRMGKIRGQWQKYKGCDLMVTYHPSFLLQYASAAMKRLVWEDMMAVMEKAGMEISEKQKGYFLSSK